MNDGWNQVGTVEIMHLRIYSIDPMADPKPLQTTVAVEPGTYPVYRKFDAYRWIMKGHINERTSKIGDGLFEMNSGDMPTGPEVQFSSLVLGAEQFAELLAEPTCQPGPEQRLRFTIVNNKETVNK